MKTEEKLLKTSTQNEPEHRQFTKFSKDYSKRRGLMLIESIREIRYDIGLRFKAKTFSNFDKSRSPAAYKICLEYARNFLDNLKNGKGLFLTGNVGSGKTHLVVAIIDYIARIHKRKIKSFVTFKTSVNMLAEIKYSFDKNSTEQVIEDYENCCLLVIDDLGSEKTTDWTNELFYKIIDYRYSNLKPLIITTNLTDQELKEKLSERLISRIYEMCKGLKLTGKDYRLEKLRLNK